jgi:hypothetical protein
MFALLDPDMDQHSQCGSGSSELKLLWIRTSNTDILNGLVKTKDDLLVGLFRHGSGKAEYCIVP